MINTVHYRLNAIFYHTASMVMADTSNQVYMITIYTILTNIHQENTVTNNFCD